MATVVPKEDDESLVSSKFHSGVYWFVTLVLIVSSANNRVIVKWEHNGKVHFVTYHQVVLVCLWVLSDFYFLRSFSHPL